MFDPSRYATILEKLRVHVQAQLQNLDAHRQSGTPLHQDTLEKQLAVSGGIDWIAESFEGRAGAPSVEFSELVQLLHEVDATLAKGTPLSAGQRLALRHAWLFLIS